MQNVRPLLQKSLYCLDLRIAKICFAICSNITLKDTKAILKDILDYPYLTHIEINNAQNNVLLELTIKTECDGIK